MPSFFSEYNTTLLSSLVSYFFSVSLKQASVIQQLEDELEVLSNLLQLSSCTCRVDAVDSLQQKTTEIFDGVLMLLTLTCIYLCLS